MSKQQKRLFVPLKTGHFQNFEDGNKSWELRGINNRFNQMTVRKGRRVELRRGYSTDDSLWGTIVDVKTFNSLEMVGIGIRHREIVPDVNYDEFVKGARELLGDYDEFIAFKVRLDEC